GWGSIVRLQCNSALKKLPFSPGMVCHRACVVILLIPKALHFVDVFASLECGCHPSNLRLRHTDLKVSEASQHATKYPIDGGRYRKNKSVSRQRHHIWSVIRRPFH